MRFSFKRPTKKSLGYDSCNEPTMRIISHKPTIKLFYHRVMHDSGTVKALL